MGPLLELLAWLVWEVLGQLVAELVWALLRAVATAVGLPEPLLQDRPRRRAIAASLACAAAATLSFVVHPAPIGGAPWMRVVALLVLPLVAGATLSIATRLGASRPRAPRRPGSPAALSSATVAFWIGVAFGAGYAGMRLGVSLVGQAAAG
jgi:hypothetical protein